MRTPLLPGLDGDPVAILRRFHVPLDELSPAAAPDGLEARSRSPTAHVAVILWQSEPLTISIELYFIISAPYLQSVVGFHPEVMMLQLLMLSLLLLLLLLNMLLLLLLLLMMML